METNGLITDVLYGSIEVTKEEENLFNSSWMQRTRRIHQLQGAHFVFPTAEHTRFTHLLGSMYLAGEFALNIYPTLRENVKDTPSLALVEETLRLAGLLHDIGMGPFGHFFDDEYLYQYGINHEDIGRNLILEDFAGIISNLTRSPHGMFQVGESIEPVWVAWLISSRPYEISVSRFGDTSSLNLPEWVKVCKPILCGPVTVDNLDYVCRDAYMTGFPVGADIKRIIHYTFVSKEGIVLHSKAIDSLQEFLTARIFLYNNVYYHKTLRRIVISLKEIFKATIEEILPGNPLYYKKEYQQLNDWSLLTKMQEWVENPDNAFHQELGLSWKKILERNLDWHFAYEFSANVETDLSDAIEILKKEFVFHGGNLLELTIDCVHADIAPKHPISEDGLTVIYDYITDEIIHDSQRLIIDRLPKHVQLLRVFCKNPEQTLIVNKLAQSIFCGKVLV